LKFRFDTQIENTQNWWQSGIDYDQKKRVVLHHFVIDRFLMRLVITRPPLLWKMTMKNVMFPSVKLLLKKRNRRSFLANTANTSADQRIRFNQNKHFSNGHEGLSIDRRWEICKTLHELHDYKGDFSRM
jgi:hypothetical protein